MRHGYAVLGDAVHDLGVDTIFGVMGEGNLDLISEWVHRCGLRYVAARHEAAAVAMATGYAHVTGAPGVATVTHGPGLANTVTALTSAVRSRLPVLLVAGDLPGDTDRFHPQNIDQRSLVAPTGAAFVDLATAAQAPAATRHALRLLVSTGRPVVLNAPTDVQAAGWPEVSGTASDAPAQVALAAPATADRVAAAARLLAQSRSPVVLAGEGAFRSGAATALAALAEHVGALLTTSLKSKDLFRGHPLDVGLSGGFASAMARALLADSDCVAVFGASLNRWTTDHGRMFPAAAIIQCDTDERAIGAVTPAAGSLPGDATATAHALLQAVKEIVPPQVDRRVAREREVASDRQEHRRRVAESRIVGQRAMTRLDQLLPDDRALVVDGGHFMGYPAMEVTVPGPQAFLWTSHFGSISLGLGTALGAAVGRPERVTVLIVGDGGLMMSLGDLDTAVRCRIPLVVVAMNDSAYGAEVHFLRHRGRPPDSALFDAVNLSDVARGLGIPAFRVHDPDRDLEPAMRAVTRRDTPVFIEVMLGHDEIAPWFSSFLERAE